MAKTKRKCGRKCQAMRKKFGNAAKASNKVCHAETKTVASYKKCMRREMKARLSKKKTKGRKKTPMHAKGCAGIHVRGAKKGKLRTGYKWAGKGRCPKPV